MLCFGLLKYFKNINIIALPPFLGKKQFHLEFLINDSENIPLILNNSIS